MAGKPPVAPVAHRVYCENRRGRKGDLAVGLWYNTPVTPNTTQEPITTPGSGGYSDPRHRGFRVGSGTARSAPLRLRLVVLDARIRLPGDRRQGGEPRC